MLLVGDAVVQHESSERFLGIALFQGVPSVKSQMVLQSGQAQPKSMDEDGNKKPDPTVFAIAYKRPRFFLFSRREPVETAETSRDVFNEPPTKEEQEVVPVNDARAALGRQAVIHTTMGDIHIKLFAEEVPKTIENFCGHSRAGYYNGNLFHRVIKAFMVQTGDPLGTGAGGESIWGGSFEDEFHRDLRHDRPFTVSMANAGKNTNGMVHALRPPPLQPRLLTLCTACWYRLTVLYHHCSHAMAGQQAHRVWSCHKRHGCGAPH